MVEVNPISSCDFSSLEEENVENIQSLNSNSQNEVIQRQFKQAVLKKDFSNLLCANHELKGKIIVKKESNEKYGQREYEGKAFGQYSYISNDKNSALKLETGADTKGNVEMEVEYIHKW